FDFTLFRLRLQELRQLGDPADVAVLAIDANQLAFIGDDEDPVAGKPRRRDAGKVQLPLALPGDEVERNHPAAAADGNYLPVIDHRIGIDGVQAPDAGGDAGPLKSVLPHLTPVLVPIGVELA